MQAKTTWAAFEIGAGITYPEIGRWEPVAGRHVGHGGRVRVVRVDVGQQVAHGSRHALAQVLGRQTMEVAAREKQDFVNTTFANGRI